MPLLEREIDMWPVGLLAGDDAVERLSRRPWWAIYTLARRDKEFSRRLRAMDIPFYAPVIEQRKRSPQGRIRKSFVPLFPGYVFLQGDDQARRQALTTNCVSRTLEIHEPERLLADLKQIARLIEADMPLLPESRIAAGTPVRVRSGPLIGVEGIVVRRQNKERLLVAVKFLQQGASLLLEDFQVEAI